MPAKATSAASVKGFANAATSLAVPSTAPRTAMLMAKPPWRTIIITAEAMAACAGGARAIATPDNCGFASAAPMPIVSIPT